MQGRKLLIKDISIFNSGCHFVQPSNSLSHIAKNLKSSPVVQEVSLFLFLALVTIFV